MIGLLGLGLGYTRLAVQPQPTLPQASNPAANPSPAPSSLPTSNAQPNFAVDTNGLSVAVATLQTNQGTIKFRFYPLDAPQTVKRMAQLIQGGFYNQLLFHRVIPGFVAQTGDPNGNGTGGSGQKLPAEFNSRKHVEGTVAMARGADRDSADSQFYISLGTHPHLDQSYTVFGQVMEGMDVAKRLHPGDKIVSLTIQ